MSERDSTPSGVLPESLRVTINQIAAQPAVISLTDADLLRYFLGIAPSTARTYAAERGFLIHYTGKGVGRRGYIVFDEAVAWFRRLAK